MECNVKNKYRLSILLFAVLTFSSFSQNKNIKFSLEEPQNIFSITLNSFYPESDPVLRMNTPPKDTVISLPSNAPNGFYEIIVTDVKNKQFSNRVYTLLIDQNFKNIEVKLTPNNIEYNNSSLNIAYLDYQKKLAIINQKKSILSFFIERYPDSQEKIIKDANERLVTLDKEANLGLENLLEKYKSHYLGRYLRIKRDSQKFTYKNFWENIDISDTQMLYTPLYQNLIPEYKKKYTNYHAKESAFISNEPLIDSLISIFSVRGDTKRYMIALLTESLRNSKENNLLQYLDKKYNYGNQCDLKGLAKEEYLKRQKLYEDFQIGKPVPEFKFEFKGEMHSIREIMGRQTIIVFYESNCEPCKKQIPYLNQWRSQGYAKYQILAVDINSSKMEHLNFIKNLKNIMHYNDYLGLDSPIVKKYGVNKTPMYFVLEDNDKKLAFKSGDALKVIEYLNNN